VTLTLAQSYNVHHLAEIVVTNPCPGGPPFTGVLNRKFSLGAIDYHGHLTIPKQTDEPGVLNPAVLPTRITLATRPAELKLAKKPSSGAFPAGTTPGTVNLPFPPNNKLTSATRRAELKLGRKTGPRASTAVIISEPTSGNRSKAGPLPSQSISAARNLLSHLTITTRDFGKHIRKTLSRGRG
jgi:hypothetical protein